MKIIVLIIALLALNSLFVGCQSADVDEEGWVEAGHIPPPDAPKPDEPEESDEQIAAAVPTPAATKAKTITPVKTTPERVVSSSEVPKPFKGGMKVFNNDCHMKKDPADSSDKVGFIKKGKKLWVDKHDANWGKVYRKSGPAYVSAKCL